MNLATRYRNQRTHIMQSQHLAQSVIDSAVCIIQVGVGSIEGDVVLDGKEQAAADVVALRIDAFSAAKQERMVADNHLAVLAVCLLDDLFGYVQTGQNSLYLLHRIATLQSGIIVALL